MTHEDCHYIRAVTFMH